MVNSGWVIAGCALASGLWIARVLRDLGPSRRTAGLYFIGLGVVLVGACAVGIALVSIGRPFLEGLNWRLSGIIGVGLGLFLGGLFGFVWNR